MAPGRDISASSTAYSRADSTTGSPPRVTCRIDGSSRTSPTSIAGSARPALRRVTARMRAASSSSSNGLTR